ncbi:Reverse transcriptase (RNA-dependent DNA polymerase) [Bacillus sp. OV194]|nr:Reverse transcriptase (RNA-dependent DNA polymerase) [Bacillus sp. OV194]
MQTQPTFRTIERRKVRKTRQTHYSVESYCATSTTWEHMKSIIEQITRKENLNQAFQKVRRNKGAAGVDEKDIEATRLYLKEHGTEIVQLIQEGKYKPQAVRRVEVPKPTGGKRNLGIPTVTDRTIQQAVVQVLTPIFEEQFSPYSFGFRPKKSAHQRLNKLVLILKKDISSSWTST